MTNPFLLNHINLLTFPPTNKDKATTTRVLTPTSSLGQIYFISCLIIAQSVAFLLVWSMGTAAAGGVNFFSTRLVFGIVVDCLEVVNTRLGIWLVQDTSGFLLAVYK